MQYTAVNYGSKRILLYTFLFFLIRDGVAVQRPDYLSRARLAPRMEDEDPPLVKNKDSTGLKVFVGPNYKDHVRAVSPSAMTSGKCCKIGERVAKEGMHCQFELHSVSRAMNHVQRAKVKFHSSTSGEAGHKPEYKGIMASVYKGLTMKVEKCYQHKDMFEKCCNYRASFLTMMRKCRDMKGADRRQCRTKTRKSFGY